VFGIGYGSFIYESQDILLSTPGVDTEVLQLRLEGENFVAHNTYLGTAAELGLTGVLLYFGVMVSTGLHLRRTAIRAFAAGADFVGRVAYALLIGLATWAVTSIFLSAETARMFWIIVGLSLALPKLVPVPEHAGAGGRRQRYAARSNAPASLRGPLGRLRPTMSTASAKPERA
jgi:O-antigen ligase